MLTAAPPDPLFFVPLHITIAVFAFVMGTVWGSFLNVCIFRIPAKKSVVSPGSACGTCGTPLRSWHNVPILGWCFLGGRCGFCGQTFGLRYPLVEFLTGLLFLAAYLQTGPSVILLFHAAFICLLIIGIFTDIDHFILPDRITIGAAFAVILISPLFQGQSFATADLNYLLRQVGFWLEAPQNFGIEAWPRWLQSLLGSLVGAGIGYGLLWGIATLGRMVFQKEAMGAGDVKLFALIGAYLGGVNSIVILFLASFLGLVVSLAGIFAHRVVGQDQYEDVNIFAHDRKEGSTPVAIRLELRTAKGLRQFPFGPYIAIAAILVLLFQTDVRHNLHGLLDAYASPWDLQASQEAFPGIRVPTLILTKPGS